MSIPPLTTEQIELIDKAANIAHLRDRVFAQEQARQRDQVYWADEIYKLKQRIEKLERYHTMQIDENRKISRRVNELQPKQEKRPFAVGDRIVVYYYRENRITGKISGIDPYGMIYFIEDGFNSAHNECPFHPKQCRRLKNKDK